MDLTGVARAIDHAVYTLLNALAVVFWRLDAALIGVSLFSYQTQDWLTGRSGEGVWFMLDWLLGPTGIIGLPLWSVFLSMALALYGLARIVRPFFSIRLVDISRLFFFAAVAHIFIVQGADLMRSAEDWRSEAGGFVFEAMADSGATLNIPGAVSSGEPIFAPRDLDGRSPIRGWEAVSGAYFLVRTADELHRSVPPAEFRKAYCLYDPSLPFDVQDETNAEGCSPRLAWDEWDQMQITLPITSVWGINIPSISLDIPLVQEHPENRQLGQRQAMAGVGRLALGPIVALYPLVEANVGLMLTLAASFIYLSLPLMVLFSFFLPTEPLFTRLLLQYINIIIRTLILQGLVALFLMLMINVSVNGSLTVYLGLIGVGLIGGFFLTRMAAATMKETMSQTFGSMSAVLTGVAVGTMGEAARRPAQQAMGAAKWVAGGAMMGAAAAGAGLGSVPDMIEPAASAAQSGQRDFRGTAPLPAGLRGLTPPAGTGWTTSSLPTQLKPDMGATTNGAGGSVPASASLPAGSPAATGPAEQGNRSNENGRTGSPASQTERWRRTGAAGVVAGHIALPGGNTAGEQSGQPPLTESAGAMRQNPKAPLTPLFRSERDGDDPLPPVVGTQSPHRPEVARPSGVTPGVGASPDRGSVPPAQPASRNPETAEASRFNRLSEAAGLNRTQREQLLEGAQSGVVSPGLRRQLEARMSKAEAEALIRSAEALPEVPSGPESIRFSRDDAERPTLRDELRREAGQSRPAKAEPEIERPAAAEDVDLPPAPGRASVPPPVSEGAPVEPEKPSLSGELKREYRQSEGVKPKVEASSPVARDARRRAGIETTTSKDTPLPPSAGGQAETSAPPAMGSSSPAHEQREAGLGDRLKERPAKREQADTASVSTARAIEATVSTASVAPSGFEPSVVTGPKFASSDTGDKGDKKAESKPFNPVRAGGKSDAGEADVPAGKADDDLPVVATGRIGFSVDAAQSPSEPKKEKTVFQKKLEEEASERARDNEE